MRVDLLAPPFRGHLHPILGIARELAPAHAVRVLSTPGTMAEVRACGLDGEALLDVEDERRLETISNPGHDVGHHPGRLLEQFRVTLDVLARARRALDARYADAAARPDLLIADFTLPVAGAVAARYGLRWWTALPSPCVLETRRGPPAYLGALAPMRGTPGHVRDGAARALVRGFKRGAARLERERLAALGLARVYRPDGAEAAYSPECILALGREDFEFGRGWPAAVRFVGPYLLTPPSAIAPPPFRRDRAHVLVTSGTHLAHRRGAFAAAALELARRRPDLEVHVSAGCAPGTASSSGAVPASGTDAMAGPPNLVRLSWVDYARALRRYALVVHHGGAGVLWRCLADGVPSVVLPIDYDQPDNAARLVHRGLAIGARDGRAVPDAVARALLDGDLARRCQDAAGQIEAVRVTRPVRTLVDALDRTLDRAGRTPGPST